MTDPLTTLVAIEQHAAERGLLLRLQVGGLLGLRTLRVVVARPRPGQTAVMLGELKGWTLPLEAGLQLDTIRVVAGAPAGVGALIWAATFCWALEETPCRRARFLAIRDHDHQHRRLVRYFRRRGFRGTREVGASPLDLALRLIWGGSGLLMAGDCQAALASSLRQLQASQGPGEH